MKEEQLTKEYVKQTLSEERLWKKGESDTFLFGDWKITLAKEDKFATFKYSVEGVRNNGVETISRRYISMEKAFLHIVNCFNDNVNVHNRFNSINEYILS